MRLLIPNDTTDALDDAAIASLYRPPAGRPWVRTTMVATVDGAAHGPNHLSGSISGAADRRMLSLSRSVADVVLVGARTVRMEGYGPLRVRPEHEPIRASLGLPEAPRIAVVTGSLDVPDKLLADPRTIVVAPGDGSIADPGRDVIRTGTDRVDLRAAIEALAERGLRHIQCEGGPALFAGLLAEGLVDELCLTVSPRLVGGDALRIVQGSAPAPTELVLASLLEEDGFLFFRWLRGQ